LTSICNAAAAIASVAQIFLVQSRTYAMGMECKRLLFWLGGGASAHWAHHHLMFSPTAFALINTEIDFQSLDDFGRV
jgi:hypothetical protein